MQVLGEAMSTFGRGVINPSFWTGLLMVYLFCRNRFRIHTCEGDGLDPPVVARSYTTKLRYGIAQATYIGGYFVIFILLVCIGSFPFLQELFKSLVGTVQVAEDVQIGSPAWAALATTSLLPSVPVMKELDQSLRDFLHDFASIPVKAHRLAEDLLTAVEAETGGAEPPAKSPQRRCEQYLCLERIAKALVDTKDPRTNRQYRAFFKLVPEFLENLQSRQRSLEEALGEQGHVSALEIEEYDLVLRRMARYLSCAMLSAESSEYAARKRLNEQLGLSGVQVMGWQFRIEQILISVVLVSLATVAGGLVSLYVYKLLTGSDLQVGEYIGLFAGWSLYTAPMFTLPLIFASGVKLYMVDRELYRADCMQWEDKFTAHLVTFLGAFFLGAFPILVGVSIRLGMAEEPAPGGAPGRYLLLGALPAVFCVVFLLRSSARGGLTWFGARASCALGSILDFVVHGGAVGMAGYLLSLYVFPNDRRMQWMALVIPLLIAGAMGWIQCAISRRYLTPDQDCSPELPPG